ncbi:unnamed protein product [Phytomonas sp. Hart1]|nr:unnamed protein product [Phytomonas sp. Hart1]|eukprot:CCW69199.1 unnamed protein product [Phytomonas sp. isolate Hart1]
MNTSTYPYFKSSVKNHLPWIAFHAEVLKGMSLEGAKWMQVKDISQISGKFSSTYQQMELHKIGDLSMLIISLVPRQVIKAKGNETFSSLLFVDAGINCEILGDALHSLDPGPYGSLQNILCRCTFTVAAFLVSDAGSDHALRLLNTQVKLCNIKGSNTHMERTKSLLKYSPEELTDTESQNTHKNMNILTMKPLTHPKKL